MTLLVPPLSCRSLLSVRADGRHRQSHRAHQQQLGAAASGRFVVNIFLIVVVRQRRLCKPPPKSQGLRSVPEPITTTAQITIERERAITNCAKNLPVAVAAKYSLCTEAARVTFVLNQ